MNKKIMYTFIPAIAAIGALVGFKSSSNRVTSSNDVVTSNSNKAINVNNNRCNDEHEHESWQPITKAYLVESEAKLTLATGSYYLDEDIDFNDQEFSTFSHHGFIIAGTDTKVDFCLNGHVINGSRYSAQSNKNTNIFSIDASCELNLYDCNGIHEKHYFVPSNEDNPDDNEWLPSDTKTDLSLDGGYLYCDGCLAVGCKGTFNMHGGSIVGRSQGVNLETTYGQQGTIISTPATCDDAKININNGTIAGCNAKDSIISVGTYTDELKKSSINIIGGVIKNSYARNAIIYNTTEFNMTGGKIHNCYTGNVKNGAYNDNAIIFNPEAASSVTKIAGDAEITDNITLLKDGLGGSVVTYKKTTTINLGGKAKVIRNKSSIDEQSQTYAERIADATNLKSFNVVCHYYYDTGILTESQIHPLTDGQDALDTGARFGIRALKKGGSAMSGYTFTKGPIKSECKQFFFSNDPQLIVTKSPLGNGNLILTAISPVPQGGQIAKKSETSSGKPTIENAILLDGKLDKSIEVVIKDKEDLGVIKEKVEEEIKNKLTEKSHLISQFDIRLESDGVEIENIDGNLYRITLKLPDTYSALSKQNVIYIKDDGSIEIKETTVNGNKCSFDTDHFSTWGFAAEGDLVPGGGGGGKVSTGSVAGIIVGSVAGSGSVFFLIFIIFFKKKLRFFVNGYKVYEERLKRNEDIDFTNSYVAGKQWYSDKECTKPFTKTKMGLLNKSVYTKSDDTYGGNRYNPTQVNSKCKLIISLKNKVKSLFKKKNKDKSEEQNNVAPEEQNNNNQNE